MVIPTVGLVEMVALHLLFLGVMEGGGSLQAEPAVAEQVAFSAVEMVAPVQLVR